MLRFGFMASDHDPTVLFWGSNADLHVLELILRSFANAPRTLALADSGLHAQTGHAITLERARQHLVGMRSSGDREAFNWYLDPETAVSFAEKIAVLVGSDRACHQYLDTGKDRFTVKVSLGEYPDRFLLE
jgi:hypothetical protein